MDKNFPSTLWKNGKLTIDRAIELLDLVDEAHNLFDATKKGWDFTRGELPTKENHGYVPIIDLSKYEILLYFGDLRPKRALGVSLRFFKQFRKELAGFIVKSKQSDDIYLVFRGTLLFYEWINNFRFIQRQSNAKACPELNMTVNQRKDPDVHRGFLDTYMSQGRNENSSMQSQIEDGLQKQIKTHHKLWITGHSRGGALAMLAAAFIRNNPNIKPSSICLCTQAQPRVGDENFALNFQNSSHFEVDINVYRIANSEDIVPVVPLASFVLAVVSNIPIISQLLKKLSLKSNFEHNGLPYYFSKQKNTIADNHTIPVYKEALWEAKLNQLLEQKLTNIYVNEIRTQQYKDAKGKILDSDLTTFFNNQPNILEQLSKNRYLKGSLSNGLKFVIFPASVVGKSQKFSKMIMLFSRDNDDQWLNIIID